MLWLIIAGTVLSAIVIGLLLRMGARDHVLRLLDWLDGMGAWGPLLFIAIQTLIVVGLVPGVLFTLGAGFLFGIVQGTLYIVAGNVIGGSLAFMFARTLLRRPVTRLLRKRPELRNLDKRLAEKGWKIILLTRVIPFFPFKLSNYCFGVMRFTYRDFVIGTALGVIPITVTNVYAGSLAGDLATMESVVDRSVWIWMVYGAGLLALLVLVGFLARAAHRRLNMSGPP